ncbi:MAG: YbaK/EbsC family protein [Synergistaceae bacterium]|jgi:prolyl-tRNA editing enzyme YbaK/EbsC (Cys-tRNA(Pro) deacylase)|nr:YbaK/EbsC family protein [Synergistaceae bacterium]
MEIDKTADPAEKVRAFLVSSGCDAVITRVEETIFTVDDASRTIGAPPPKILKSMLFFIDDRCWALALMSGANKVHDKKVKRALGAQKVRMGTAEAIMEFSGFAPGGVPPVGYPEQPTTLLDADLFRHDVVWSAAGTDHDFFPITPDELLRITGGVKADIKK